jgi:hypothetical protein
LLTEDKVEHRIRAWTGEIDGKPIGFGGIMYLPDTVMAFLHAPDESAKAANKFALHRAAVRFLKHLEDIGVRQVVACADEKIEKAEEWLRRLGFVHTYKEIWVWHSSRLSQQ